MHTLDTPGKMRWQQGNGLRWVLFDRLITELVVTDRGRGEWPHGFWGDGFGHPIRW